MITALDGCEGSASRPGCCLPPGKTRYPLYRRLVWHQGQSGQVRKISPTPGFDPRTIQILANRYIDYATRPTFWPILRQYSGMSTQEHIQEDTIVCKGPLLYSRFLYTAETCSMHVRAFKLNK